MLILWAGAYLGCASDYSEEHAALRAPPAQSIPSYAAALQWVHTAVGAPLSVDPFAESEGRVPPRDSGKSDEQFLQETTAQIAAWLYGSGLQFDSLPADSLAHLHPAHIFQRGRGGCLPVTFAALVAGERLGLEVHAVSVPSHVFARFCAGKKCRNFEPNRGGWAYSDSEYLRKYGLSGAGHEVLQELNPEAFIGLWLHEAGNISLRRAQKFRFWRRTAELERCVQFQEWAVQRVPLAAAVGNRAICLHMQGKSPTALALLDSLWNAGHRDLLLQQNRTRLLRSMGQTP